MNQIWNEVQNNMWIPLDDLLNKMFYTFREQLWQQFSQQVTPQIDMIKNHVKDELYGRMC